MDPAQNTYEEHSILSTQSGKNPFWMSRMRRRLKKFYGFSNGDLECENIEVPK